MVASVSSAVGSALRLEALGHAHTRRGVLLLLTAMVTAIAADSTAAGEKIPFADAVFVLILLANGLLRSVQHTGMSKLFDWWATMAS